MGGNRVQQQIAKDGVPRNIHHPRNNRHPINVNPNVPKGKEGKLDD